MRSSLTWLLLATGAVGLFGAWWVFRSRSSDDVPVVLEAADLTETKPIAEVVPDKSGAAPLSDGEEQVIDVWVEDLPKADRPLGQKLVDACESENLPALRKLLPEIRSSANAAVRLRAVEGFDWFGKDAIVELTAFLGDKDQEVAEAAFNAWDTAVDQVEDEPFRIKAAAEVMKTLSDPDALSSVATKLEGAEDRKAALLALAEVAESGNKPAMDTVKESYEFIAGEEWVDVAKARAKAMTIDAEEQD